MFNPHKPVQTRDGREAGIYTTDHPGKYPIVGYIKEKKGRVKLFTWTKEGLWSKGRQSPHDLVNIPEKHDLWLVISRTPIGTLFPSPYFYNSRAEAEESLIGCSENIVAIVSVSFGEGEGIG